MKYVVYFFYSLFVALVPWQTAYFLRESFINGEKWHYGTIAVYASDVILVALIIAALWQQRRRVCEMLCYHPTWRVAWVVIFVSYVFFSALWAYDGALALYYGVKVLTVVGLIAVSRLLQINVRILIAVFITSLTIQAGIGIWQFVMQETFASTLFGMAQHVVSVPGTSVIDSDGRWLRAYGAQAHPNIFGGLMALGLVLALGCGMTCYRIWRMYFVGCSIVLFLGLLMSFSRAGLLAAIVGMTTLGGALIYERQPWRRTYGMLMGVFVVIGGVFVSQFFHLYDARVVHMTSQEYINLEERTEQIAQALTLFRAHPFFGVGGGNYTMTLMREDSFIHAPWYYQPVHHTGLLLLSELGLVGFGLLVVVVGIFIARVWRLLQTQQSTQRFTTLCILVALVTLCVTALFDHWQWDSHSGIFITGMLLAILSIATSTKKSTTNCRLC